MNKLQTTIKILFIFFYLFIIHCSNHESSTKWPTAGWEIATATSQGVNYDSLYVFSTQLESGDLGYIDGMLVIRNGMIVFEKEYTNDYDSLFKTTGTKQGKYNYYDPLWHPYYNNTRCTPCSL